MKNKKKLLVAVAAMGLLAVGTAGVGTMAWYTADANATVKSAAGTGGSLETTTSTISAGQYVINFVIAPVDDELELSHVATAAGTDGAGATIAVGDLIYGVVSNGTATTRKCAAVTNFITSYSVEASWASDPTDPADIAYLNGKRFTVATGVSGQAKLLASSAVTGLSNLTEGSVTFDITYSAGTWTFTAASYTNQYVHIEPQRMDDTAESSTVGAVTIDANQSLALSATPAP